MNSREVGKDGMKIAKGTITKIDKDTKTVAVKSAHGTEKTLTTQTMPRKTCKGNWQGHEKGLR